MPLGVSALEMSAATELMLAILILATFAQLIHAARLENRNPGNGYISALPASQAPPTTSPTTR